MPGWWQKLHDWKSWKKLINKCTTLLGHELHWRQFRASCVRWKSSRKPSTHCWFHSHQPIPTHMHLHTHTNTHTHTHTHTHTRYHFSVALGSEIQHIKTTCKFHFRYPWTCWLAKLSTSWHFEEYLISFVSGTATLCGPEKRWLMMHSLTWLVWTNKLIQINIKLMGILNFN